MKRIALALIVLAAPAASAAETETATCRDLLAETLGLMERRPVLKEELATGLMWMRKEAEEARAAGDEARCIALLIRVKDLLT